MKKIHSDILISCLMLLFSINSNAQNIKRIDLKGKYGYVDDKYNRITDIIYEDAAESFSEGLACVKMKGKWGYINMAGKKVIPYKYEEASNFYNGVASVKSSGKWGVINSQGTVIIPFIYESKLWFHNGFAVVEVGDKYGAIDRTGKEIVPFKYDLMHMFIDGYSQVKLNGKNGFIDTTGKEVIPCIYDYIGSFHEGLAPVRLENKWGFMNTSLKIAIPIIYDNTENFYSGIAKVKLNGEVLYIKPNGKIYDPNAITEPTIELTTKNHTLNVYRGWDTIFGKNIPNKQYLTSIALGLKTSNLFAGAPNSWIKNDSRSEVFYGTMRFSFDDSETESTIEKEKNSFIDYCIFLSNLPENEIKYLEEEVTLDDGRKGLLLFYFTDRAQNIGYILNCVIYTVSEKNSNYVSIYRYHMEGNSTPPFSEQDFPGWKDYFKKVLLTIKPKI